MGLTSPQCKASQTRQNKWPRGCDITASGTPHRGWAGQGPEGWGSPTSGQHCEELDGTPGYHGPCIPVTHPRIHSRHHTVLEKKRLTGPQSSPRQSRVRVLAAAGIIFTTENTANTRKGRGNSGHTTLSLPRQRHALALPAQQGAPRHGAGSGAWPAHGAQRSRPGPQTNLGPSWDTIHIWGLQGPRGKQALAVQNTNHPMWPTAWDGGCRGSTEITCHSTTSSRHPTCPGLRT